jgi:hypothetical protein
MRHAPILRALKFKLPEDGRVYEDVNGAYRIPGPLGAMLTVQASDGLGWDHVSVSLAHRCPTWEEMDFVKQLFFKDGETAMQLHVPRADHQNTHRFCLHLWRPQDWEIPRPATVMV